MAITLTGKNRIIVVQLHDEGRKETDTYLFYTPEGILPSGHLPDPEPNLEPVFQKIVDDYAAEFPDEIHWLWNWSFAFTLIPDDFFARYGFHKIDVPLTEIHLDRSKMVFADYEGDNPPKRQ